MPAWNEERPSAVFAGRNLEWVLTEVRNEVRRAEEKFPSNRKLLAALGEEFGEVCRALLQGTGEEPTRRECIQVAAVAVRLAYFGDPDFPAAAPVGLCVSCGRAVEVTSVGEPGICVDCSH